MPGRTDGRTDRWTNGATKLMGFSQRVFSNRLLMERKNIIIFLSFPSKFIHPIVNTASTLYRAANHKVYSSYVFHTTIDATDRITARLAKFFPIWLFNFLPSQLPRTLDTRDQKIMKPSLRHPLLVLFSFLFSFSISTRIDPCCVLHRHEPLHITSWCSNADIQKLPFSLISIKSNRSLNEATRKQRWKIVIPKVEWNQVLWIFCGWSWCDYKSELLAKRIKVAIIDH